MVSEVVNTLTAIDVGYYSVKGIATNSRTALFPSVIGSPLRGGGFSMVHQDRKMNITVRDREGGEVTYPIGMTALEQAQYVSSRRDSRWVRTDTYRLLFYAVLSELHLGTLVTNVVTGLPIGDWDAWAEPLRQQLVGEHTFRRNGGRWQTVTVSNAVVITQPYGSLLDQAMNDQGIIVEGPFATGTVGVADFGGKTVNFLVTDALNEREQWSISDDLGLLKALESIAIDIKKAHPGFTPRPHEVAKWVAEGEFPYQGERKDIKPFADPHLEPLVAHILNRMSEVWTEPGRLAAVLLTGGGAMTLGPRLKARMDGHFPNVFIAKDAQFSNVRGYLKFARDMWR